ncbi:guanylate cyclase 32E-like [Palaemon carinicauda]|uniref:guanylate cyclase 32E-like n=1 Tax=Palaemon carinicauda TaxID=392227 RepID=UPI0035B655E1
MIRANLAGGTTMSWSLAGHLVIWAVVVSARGSHHLPRYQRTFNLGYLTGSERLPEDQEYKRPGLIISGAITLAVEEVNTKYPLVNGHRVNFTVAETYGQEEMSILKTAKLWISNISAYIGPQETCVHEARMASAFNLPMISYFCTHPETSDKINFPTFARTRPPDTQISKSVTSILKTFNWRKVTFFYNNSPDENFNRVARTIVRTLPRHNISIQATKSWDATYHHGYDRNPFVSMIRETYMDSRIYVVLGHYYEFLGLMTIMEEKGLFQNGEYFVVGVTLSQYDKNKPDKYLRDLLNEHTNSTVQAAFQNFLGVVPSPSPSFELFANKVNDYLEKPPFNHPNALTRIGGRKNIRAEAAYLYDAVHVYARALNETLKSGGNPHNGRALIASILGTTYKSAMGNWRYEQELDSLLWKIDYKDIKTNDWTPNHNPVQNKLPRGLYSTVRTSQLSLSSNPDLDFRYASVYTQLGLYKGRVVAVKQVSSKAVDVTRRIKKELKTMRDLRHDNLLGFIGACVDAPNVCIVTEYCSRGSLKDILENEDVKLDSMFIASLVGDIVQGMVYLHDSAVKSHGNLKTSNCLVDSRWVVKITDFGLHELKSGTEATALADPGETQRKCNDLLYSAPELLRDSSAPPGGTQKGDVYSFAIILYEVHGRQGPWGRTDQNPVVIIRQVMTRPAPNTPPFRPPLNALEGCLDCIRTVLSECWAETPEDRPDFRVIRTKLRPLKKGMKPNIFDNMLAMMEKYANNLEALVDERTDQLIEEKKKTEALLYEMLPRYVAEQLKRGRKVEAENFDCVTIYFSDIVGFTEMSAESTPLQVVDFLNDLYTCFDSIIGNYDVYKVETIGDAYMVVSGLPIRNDDQHAGEVASMSIHLLEAIKRFKIRHRPSDTLKLRIGLHSGPVCAGVVGLKMPRYCLFGDTVNTASRMESTGQALRIHCSCTFRDILVNVGGYFLEERGKVKVKGKGEMTTYWLTGEDPDLKRHREWSRRQRGIPVIGLTKNGCVGGLRGSLRSCKNMPVSLPRTLSLESPKRLRFAMSEELATRVVAEVREERDSSPPPPQSPASDDCTVRKVNLEVKRNSCPCIKEHASLSSALVAPSSSEKRSSISFTTNTIARLEVPASPASGDDDGLSASRRTSISEVMSRPSSLVEGTDDQDIIAHSTGEPPPDVQPRSPRFDADFSNIPASSPCRTATPSNLDLQKDSSKIIPFSIDLKMNLPLTPSRSASTRSASTSSAMPVTTSLLGSRFSISTNGSGGSSLIGNGSGSNTSRWRSQNVVPLSLRSATGSSEALPTTSSSADVNESRAPRLRYCSKQEVCSTANDCEESSPLLSSVVNYRVINEVHKLPDRETPV